MLATMAWLANRTRLDAVTRPRFSDSSQAP